MNQVIVPFRPRLQGVFQERFYDKISFFQTSNINIAQIEELVKKEVNWVTMDCKINLQQRRVYRAAWVLLRDLLRTGWQYKLTNGVLELMLPSKYFSIGSVPEMITVKADLRSCMESSRLEKIVESRDFIMRMEHSNGDKKPISSLIANGCNLYNDINEITKLTSEQERISALKECIKPYLQLVVENEKDIFTGHKLSEIWRYFRLTWSNTAESTPGRTMQYLIRDAARDNHPVMGIASLENTALQITCRDDSIGWTANAFKKRIKDQYGQACIESFKELLEFISLGISGIDLTGLCTIEECEHPDNSLINTLKNELQKSAREREDALKNNEDLERSELGSRISKSAENALYMRKRAEQLAALLYARKRINEILAEGTEEALKGFAESEDGQTVIRTALLAVKKIHIGSSMMELNVCGAIPPYNHILGGKLVALLMLSAEVIDNYRNRYGNSPSEIASRLKGEKVTRPAELVFVGTTSLYHVGSSQYNRLKLPAGMFGENSAPVAWKELGVTVGYGTMHISDITSKSLVDIAKSQRGFSPINNVFGEGTSPKLRMINMGVRDIMEEGIQNIAANEFPKHSMARIVYGAALINNSTDYLFGRTNKPQYYFGELGSKEVSERIIDYWRSRWLLMRLKHRPALTAIQSFNKAEFLVSNSLLEGEGRLKYVELEEANVMTTAGGVQQQESRLDYIRGLYRGKSSYADFMDMDTLKHIHVETKLDSAIISVLQAGKSVVLTGNPGDGKTHILRILENKLKEINPEAIIELDASCLKDNEIFERWRLASETGKPFCIAINEAVLFSLADQYPEFEPIRESKAQVVNAVFYDNEAAVTYNHVVVFDLSLRNTLDKDIICSIIDKQTSPSVMNNCDGCIAIDHCDFTRNALLLKNEKVIERLQYIFERLNRRGYHITLRELEGYISFLLFAGRSCEQLSRGSSSEDYCIQNLFFGSHFGKGRLFERLKNTFDPIQISHPIIDERLVNGDFPPETWIPGFNAESSMIEPDNLNRFETRKRAFYFFNIEGDKLTEIADDDESEFARFMQKPQRDALRQIIRRINRFFGDTETVDAIHAWQSHRYDLSPRRILYSHVTYSRNDFEIVTPKLSSIMGQGFSLRSDHVLLRLKDKPGTSLKIDFDVFEVLANAERGVPMMYIESSVTRRIWQFIERLDKSVSDSEVIVSIYDTQTREHCNTEIDMVSKQYIGITEGRG